MENRSMAMRWKGDTKMKVCSQQASALSRLRYRLAQTRATRGHHSKLEKALAGLWILT